MTFGFDDLKRVLVDGVGLSAAEVGDDPSATFEDIGLDSLAFIQLKVAFEEEWGIEIRDEDAESIYTLRDAVEYVRERLTDREARWNGHG